MYVYFLVIAWKIENIVNRQTQNYILIRFIHVYVFRSWTQYFYGCICFFVFIFHRNSRIVVDFTKYIFFYVTSKLSVKNRFSITLLKLTGFKTNKFIEQLLAPSIIIQISINIYLRIIKFL